MANENTKLNSYDVELINNKISSTLTSWANNSSTPLSAYNLNKLNNHIESLISAHNTNAPILEKTLNQVIDLDTRHNSLSNDLNTLNDAVVGNAKDSLKSKVEDMNKLVIENRGDINEIDTTVYTLNNNLNSLQSYVDSLQLCPDDFEGTDTEKLQQAFDALKDTGGIVSLNRMYEPEHTIFIKHQTGTRSDSTYDDPLTVTGTDNKPIPVPRRITHSLMVTGVGENAGIDCTCLKDDYLFMGGYHEKELVDTGDNNIVKRCIRKMDAGDVRFSNLNILGHPKRSLLHMGGLYCENRTIKDENDLSYYPLVVNEEGVPDETLEPDPTKKITYTYSPVLLIRVSFNNCTISGFKHVAQTNRYIQSLHFTDCTIREIGRGYGSGDISTYYVSNRSNPTKEPYGAVIDAYNYYRWYTTNEQGKPVVQARGSEDTVYDLMINNCIFEWCGRLLVARNPAGVSITNSLIEGFQREPFWIGNGYSYGLFISNNYFEKNDLDTHWMHTNRPDATNVPKHPCNINLSLLYDGSNVTIENNRFDEGSSSRHHRLILLPSNIKHSIKITGNNISSYSILYDIQLMHCDRVLDHSGLIAMCNGNFSTEGNRSTSVVNTALDNALHYKPINNQKMIDGSSVIFNSVGNSATVSMIEGKTRFTTLRRKAESFETDVSGQRSDLDCFRIENNKTYIDISHAFVTKNLLPGELLAKSINGGFGSKAEINMENKTVEFRGEYANTNTTIFDGFEPNKQYTIILCGSGNVVTGANNYEHLNLELEYDSSQLWNAGFSTIDGNWETIPQIIPKDDNKKYYIFKTKRDASVVRIRGTYNGGTTKLYYDNCGIFEGDIDVTSIDAIEELFGAQYPCTIKTTTVTLDGEYPLYGLYSKDMGWPEPSGYCDKLDLLNKQYIKRIKYTTFDKSLFTGSTDQPIFDDTNVWVTNLKKDDAEHLTANSLVVIKIPNETKDTVLNYRVLCNSIESNIYVTKNSTNEYGANILYDEDNVCLMYRFDWDIQPDKNIDATKTYATKNSVLKQLAEYLTSNTIKVYYVLKTPEVSSIQIDNVLPSSTDPLFISLVDQQDANNLSIIQNGKTAIHSFAGVEIEYLTQRASNYVPIQLYDELRNLCLDLSTRISALENSHGGTPTIIDGGHND